MDVVNAQRVCYVSEVMRDIWMGSSRNKLFRRLDREVTYIHIVGIKKVRRLCWVLGDCVNGLYRKGNLLYSARRGD